MKNALMKHANDVCWRKLAKKHEIEELKEGVCFEPAQASLKRKVSHRRTARHAAQAWSWVIGGSWKQQRLYDRNLGGQQELQVLRSRKYGQAQTVSLQGVERERKQNDQLGELECTASLGSRRGSRMEGFRSHVAICGSVKGVSGKDAACGWAVVQLDCDTEEEPWLAIYGSILAELEVQRTIKSAEIWAFTMALAEPVGTSTIHTGNLGTWDGLRRGEEGCIGPKQKDADSWIFCRGELLMDCVKKNSDLDVKHVRAHRTGKEQKAMTVGEQSVRAGNEKADELAKDGPEMDGRAMAAAKAQTTKQLRKQLYASIECAAHFHVQVEEWKDWGSRGGKREVDGEKEATGCSKKVRESVFQRLF